MDTRQVYAVLNNRTEEDESKGNIYIEENKCAICDEYMIPNQNVVKLGCKDNQGRLTNHAYHYECILMSYKVSRTMECPICRKKGGWLPLPEGKKLERFCHREWKEGLTSYNRCQAILKSGQNKGKKCLAIVYNPKKKYCGKHRNIDKKESVFT